MAKYKSSSIPLLIVAMLAGFAIYFGIIALVALFVAWAFGFVFGVEVTFWQAFVGIFLVSIVSNLVFGGLRAKGGDA